MCLTHAHMHAQVVADPKMRKALLQGPLAQPKPRRPVLVDEDTQDKTFNWLSFKIAAP